jgi:branched-chain amino acid transport system ATP-binding protein
MESSTNDAIAVAEDNAILRTTVVTKKFLGLTAVNRVSFVMPKGIVASIIGPNGAGKTTFFNLLSGAFLPTEGQVFMEDEDITRMPSYKRVMKGIGRTFQISTVFPNLTVFENILVAAQRFTVFESRKIFGGRFSRRDEQSENIAEQILREMGILKHRDTLAGAVPHGLKQRIEIGMILTLNPKVLLLDETFAGLSVGEADEQINFIRKLSETLTILLVEHNMDVVMRLSKRISVMHQGSIIVEGTPEDIKANEYVQKIYLREDV